MPEKVKILKAVDNDTFKVQLKDGTIKSVRLVSGNNQAWYDGFEKNQPGFKLDESVSNLIGKEVNVNFRKLTEEQYQSNSNRELGSISTKDIPDLAEHLFSKNQVYKRDIGKDWTLNIKEEPKDSLISPQQFKATQSLLIKKEQGLEPKKILAYQREISKVKQKFGFNADKELVDFIGRRSVVPYESLKTFQTKTQLTPMETQTKTNILKVTPYNGKTKTYQKISVDEANALIDGDKIKGTNIDELKSQLEQTGAIKDLTHYELHQSNGTKYLFPVFKGNSSQQFNQALKTNEGDYLNAFGNKYATSDSAIKEWKDQFGIGAKYDNTLENKLKVDSGVPDMTQEVSKKLLSILPKFKTVEERNTYYKNLEDQNIKKGLVKSNESNFEIGLPSKKKLLKEGLFNFKSEKVSNNTDPNDSWYIGSGSDREFSGLEKTIVGGTAVGSMFKVAQKIPFVSAIPIAANAIINMKKEAEMGDLEWQDAARESQKIAAELLLLSTIQKIGGSKPIKWIKDKSGKLVPSGESLKGAGKSVLKFAGKGAAQTWKSMEKALGEVTEQATKKSLPVSTGKVFNKTFYDKVMEKGGILKFQNGQALPYVNPPLWATNTPVYKNTRSAKAINYIPRTTVVTPTGTTKNFSTLNTLTTLPSQGVVQPIQFSNKPTSFLNPVANTTIIPAGQIENIDTTSMILPETQQIAKKTYPKFGYQEANLALSVLPSLLNTKVKADRLSYQPYNPEIKGIQGDPLLQQRLTSIAQNKYLQNKATSSDPSQELVRRLVVNRQAIQGNQDAYNIDTQARIADTQRYYGEKNAANQFNYTNKQNIDNQNIQMNNNAMMQNAAQKNQVTGQTIQNIMGYMTNKANDQNLVSQNYMAHKNIENQGVLDNITQKYASMYHSGLTNEQRNDLNFRYNQEISQARAKYNVNNVYSPYVNQLKKAGVYQYKKGGSISDETKILSVITTKATNLDKLFIDSARKYNELSSKVSTEALNRGSKLVVATLNNLPKSTLKSLPFKKIF